MVGREDKIKDLFSTKFKGFEPELDNSIWDRIDSVLSSTIAQPKVQIKNSSRLRLIKYSAIAACFVAVVGYAATQLTLKHDYKIEAMKPVFETMLVLVKKEIINEKPPKVTYKRRKHVVLEKPIEIVAEVEKITIPERIVKKKASLYSKSRISVVTIKDGEIVEENSGENSAVDLSKKSLYKITEGERLIKLADKESKGFYAE